MAIYVDGTIKVAGFGGRRGPQGPEGSPGKPGENAYQIALDNGFVGTEKEWLASLKGEAGQDGAPGRDGADGKDGDPGPQGPPGKDGEGVPPGGTTGQVLSKASDADGDVKWTDPAAGVSMEQVNESIRAAVLDSWEGMY